MCGATVGVGEREGGERRRYGVRREGEREREEEEVGVSVKERLKEGKEEKKRKTKEEKKRKTKKKREETGISKGPAHQVYLQ